MNPADEGAARDEISAMSGALRFETDLEPLLDRIGDARIVMLGEASHGTSEYYRWRTAITGRLVAEFGFDFVAVEGDWPDCHRIDRWVKGADDGVERAAEAVLRTFERWPTWMWANTDVVDLMEWMRLHNREDRDSGAGVGFYGLDVYSLWDSLRIVMDHVREHDPETLEAAEAAWRCFEPYGEDPQRYARATRLVPEACEDEVVELLVSLRDGRENHREPGDGDAGGTGTDPDEEAFLIHQNAEVVAGAERYYRTMVRADGESWNVRDHHMMDTLDRLLDHHGPNSKAVVWAHNTHVGDARATDMAAHDMVNLGQLARERHDGEVVLVGFGSHSGTVLAGSSWGSPMRIMEVPAAPEGTHEDLLHRQIGGDALFVFDDDRSGPWLTGRRGHRAIGVVYDPGRDRFGNWVPTVMGARYDAFLFFDRTTHLEPITPTRVSAEGEIDTAPWAS